MNSRFQIYLLMAFKLYDVTVMTCCFAMTAIIAKAQQGPVLIDDFLTVRLQVTNVAIFLVLLFVWHLIFTSLDLYQSKRLSTSPFADAPDVLKATSLGTLVLLLVGPIFSVKIINPTFLIIFWILASTLLLLSRVILRSILHKVRRWRRNLKHVVIIGTNQRAVEIGTKLEATRELGYHLIGFVDDHWHGLGAKQYADHALVADLSSFQTYLQDHVIDEVIICVPIKSFYDKASQIIAQCDEQGILVRFASDIFTPTQRRALVDEFDDQYVVTINPVTYNDGLLVKHLIDFVVSLTLLTVLSPLFLVVAVLVKITSSGPVLFVQERVGLNKRRFYLYKFRTMVADAEVRLAGIEHLNEVAGPVFKISQDPRITPLGGLLRRTSIDELPQLINVIKGDMSLVGPRPLPVRDYNGFDQDCHRRRLSVRPGITGLWQVEGRSSIAFDRWMELDLKYIDQWSLWLDIKILFKTIPAVLRGTGAS